MGRGVCRSDRGSAEVVEAFEAQFTGIWQVGLFEEQRLDRAKNKGFLRFECSMKQCHTCKTYAKDEDDFCPSCGSSFDVKLCPKKHRNPVWAAYCGTCGSDRLSRPHPTGRAEPRLRFAVWIALGAVAGMTGLGAVVLVRWAGAGDSWQAVLLLFAVGLLALAHVRMR